MSEHISKSKLFCNKRNTVKSFTLDPNISILDMSCEYKKICGYEADRCHAYLKNIIYILCPQKVTGPSYNKHCTTHIFPYRLSASIYTRQVLFTVYAWSGL